MFYVYSEVEPRNCVNHLGVFFQANLKMDSCKPTHFVIACPAIVFAKDIEASEYP